MNDTHALQSRRVLVAEDEYFIAEDMRMGLEKAGATVLGPAPSVSAAISLVESSPDIDCAVLDVNLGSEKVLPVADALAARGVPFLFTTGYDQGMIPERYAHVVRCEKPVDFAKVVRAILQVMAA